MRKLLVALIPAGLILSVSATTLFAIMPAHAAGSDQAWVSTIVCKRLING